MPDAVPACAEDNSISVLGNTTECIRPCAEAARDMAGLYNRWIARANGCAEAVELYFYDVDLLDAGIKRVIDRETQALRLDRLQRVEILAILSRKEARLQKEMSCDAARQSG